MTITIRHSLYWSGPDLIGIDSIVEPGSYWQRVMSAPLIEARDQPGVGRVALPSGQSPAVLLELVLEWVRQAEFPTLPSRASSHFVWEDEAWARKYHETLRNARLYEVQPVGDARLFRADYTLGNAFREGDTLAKLIDRARRYWRGERTGQSEILIQGSIQVIRVII